MTYPEIYKELSAAIAHFWRMRTHQKKTKGKKGTDIGERKAVTGGKHMDAFIHLLKRIICAAGVDEEYVHTTSHLDLPGFFRPSKR